MPNMRLGGVNPIVTLTPLLARPGSHRLAICAENREAFASVVLELMSQWERVEISEAVPIAGQRVVAWQRTRSE